MRDLATERRRFLRVPTRHLHMSSRCCLGACMCVCACPTRGVCRRTGCSRVYMCMSSARGTRAHPVRRLDWRRSLFITPFAIYLYVSLRLESYGVNSDELLTARRHAPQGAGRARASCP